MDQDISSIYLFGAPLTVQPTGTSFDPSKGAKFWIRPIQPGEKPGKLIILQCASTADLELHEFAITAADAAQANVPPPAYLSSGPSLPMVPYPVRDLAANEVLVAGLPGTYPRVRTVSTSEGYDDHIFVAQLNLLRAAKGLDPLA